MRFRDRLICGFLIWVIFQLLVIGAALGNALDKVENKTWDCSHVGGTPATLLGIIFPLVAFAPHEPKIDKYCEGKP